MFENATRMKLRFEYRGNLSVEDLWDLPVEALDDIFKALNTQAKQQAEESLLDKRDKASEIVDLKINLVKRIVTVKLDEQEAREKAADRRAERERILEALEYKEGEELRSMSAKELRKKARKLAD